MRANLLLLALLWASSVLAQAPPSNASSADTLTYPASLHIVHTQTEYRLLAEAQPDHLLVNLSTFIPGIHLDMRYAGKNNFMHRAVYSGPRAYLTLAAALQLKAVEEVLHKSGLGLIIYDAYRPYSVTVRIFTVVGDTDYAASPKTGSRHNRGCAVDLGLIQISDGKVLEMPTAFDSFDLRAHSDYTQIPPVPLANRLILKTAMEQAGFTELRTEWWHFDFKTWRQYPLLDVPFNDL